MTDYSYILDDLDLSDVADHVRIEDEAGTSFLDPGMVIPGRPGMLFDSEADLAPLILPLRVILHPYDQAEHLSEIKKRLNRRGLRTLKRTLTYPGTVQRALVKQISKPVQGPDRSIFTFMLTAPSGSWQDNSESSATGNPPTATTGGDTEIHDPRISIAGAGQTKVTLADGTVYTITAVSGPTFPVVVDVGAGTVLDNGGADASGAVTFSHEHWLRLDPDDTVAITTDTSVTLYWRNRWG